MPDLHPTAAKGFGTAAELYQQTRPSYPQEIISWLRNDLNLGTHAKVVDLAAGTGKFTSYIKQVTSDIIAIEPVEQMQQQFLAIHPDIAIQTAYSHQLPLGTASYDAVLCAQAFHWFSNAETLQEVHRVLKPEGHFGLIWNQRDTSTDWVQAIAELIAPFEKDTPRYHSGQWKHAFQQQNWFKLDSEHHFIHPHIGTVEQVVSKRILSSSFIAALPTEQQQQLKLQIEDIVFHAVSKQPQDEIAFPYVTYAYDFIRL